ncbi:hypothetical protein K1719_044255 [Acacia pycnantha]|nr:hypothetical protein K1719_044255 [Acacia pycnantha]
MHASFDYENEGGMLSRVVSKMEHLQAVLRGLQVPENPLVLDPVAADLNCNSKLWSLYNGKFLAEAKFEKSPDSFRQAVEFQDLQLLNDALIANLSVIISLERDKWYQSQPLLISKSASGVKSGIKATLSWYREVVTEPTFLGIRVSLGPDKRYQGSSTMVRACLNLNELHLSATRLEDRIVFTLLKWTKYSYNCSLYNVHAPFDYENEGGMLKKVVSKMEHSSTSSTSQCNSISGASRF